MGLTRNWDRLNPLLALGIEIQERECRAQAKALSDAILGAASPPRPQAPIGRPNRMLGGLGASPNPVRRSPLRSPPKLEAKGPPKAAPINFYRKLQTDPLTRAKWFDEVTWQVQNYPPGYRTDGVYIYTLAAYGDPDSPFGWDVDHIRPVERGGGDEASNLRPLRCSINRGHRGR